MNNRHNNVLPGRVIGLAMAVQRHLGSGLLESVYEECLCLKLLHAGIPHVRQLKHPIRYKGTELEYCYKIHITVDYCLANLIPNRIKIGAMCG